MSVFELPVVHPGTCCTRLLGVEPGGTGAAAGGGPDHRCA